MTASAPKLVPDDIVVVPEKTPVMSPFGGIGCPCSDDFDDSSVMGATAEVSLVGKCAK